MTEPNLEAVEAVRRLLDNRECEHEVAFREEQGVSIGCEECEAADLLTFIRDAIHRDGAVADAIREALGLRLETQRDYGDGYYRYVRRPVAIEWREVPHE